MGIESFAAIKAAATAPYQEMGATMLAMQEPIESEKLPKPSDDWDSIYTHLTGQMGALRSWRYSWWSHWAKLAELFNPRRYRWFVTSNVMNRGNTINDAIIDSTGLLAVRTCSSGMWTGLTSPSRPWFELEIAIPGLVPTSDDQDWLEDTQEVLYRVFGQSNFYTMMAQLFQDVTVFGTSPMLIIEDFEDVIRCYLPCAGEYFLSQGARLSIDGFYREYNYTVQQIVEAFRIDNCPPSIQKLYRAGGGSLQNEYVVCHAIEPNFPIAKRGSGKDTIRVMPSVFPYREFHWLKAEQGAKPLSKMGFFERPFIAARWATSGNDAYGRSPCMDALGDNKQVQHETLRKAEFIEKGIRPPMLAGPEMKNEPMSVMPGMITFTSTEGGKKGFSPAFEVNPGWLPAITNDIDMVSKRIEKALFVELFMAISRMEGVQPRNELELTKRDLERLQELGPFVEQFETECAGPAIARALAIVQRRGLTKPRPQTLQNVPLKVNYVSIMKLAQRSSQSVAMKDVMGTMGAMSSAAKAGGLPDPLRIFDLDKSARKYGELNNYPADCIHSEDDVAKHDAIRAKAMQQAQAAQQGPANMMAAVQAAKTLSDIQQSQGGAGGGAPPGG